MVLVNIEENSELSAMQTLLRTRKDAVGARSQGKEARMAGK